MKNEGYQVETGYDGEEAVELAREGNFDLIILDLMMPKIDGLQACMRIREFSNVPIIMLTARSEDTDKIIGFECGADDYITKPFNILELKARVRALLRRSGAAGQRQAGRGALTVGHIRLDPSERSAWKDGKPVDLTAKEFDLMELLMRNPGRVYSRENLLNVVWGYEYIGGLPHGGRAHPPPAGEAGAGPGQSGIHPHQVGGGLLPEQSGELLRILRPVTTCSKRG